MQIAKMTKADASKVLEMMKVFYASPAVLTSPSDEILMQNIKDCISDLPFVEGFVFKENNEIIGYAMIANSYSTEYGGICIWIEDIYFFPKYQGKGLVKEFFDYIEKNKRCVRFRLEVEDSNKFAIKAYEKGGFKKLNYIQMTKEF